MTTTYRAPLCVRSHQAEGIGTRLNARRVRPGLRHAWYDALIVVHNHSSGDPTPSQDDARLTVRLCAAADVLDIGLLDHLIVGEAERYFSFHEAGALHAVA